METTETVHKGKWGYYPCSRETFLKLKKLNKRLFTAKKKAAAWHRWARKAPHNRKGSEPAIDEMFSKIVAEPGFPGLGYYLGDRTANSYWINDKRKEIQYETDQKTYRRKPVNADEYAYYGNVNCGEVHVDTFGIDRAYSNARKPKADPDEVTPLDVSVELIDELHAQL